MANETQFEVGLAASILHMDKLWMKFKLNKPMTDSVSLYYNSCHYDTGYRKLLVDVNAEVECR